MEETRVELRSLDDRVRAGIDQIRTEDAALRQQAASGEHQQDLVTLYRRANATPRSIDRLGLRVLTDPLDSVLRIRAVERAPDGDPMWFVELQFEDDDMNLIGDSVVWSEGEDADEVFLRLADGLRRAGRWPGDEAFSAQALLAAVVRDLGRIIDIREGPAGSRQVRQIVQLIDQWAITREGLDCIRSESAWAEREGLIGHDVARTYQRLEERQVEVLRLDKHEFNRAYDTAQRIHAEFAKHHPGRPPWRRQSD